MEQILWNLTCVYFIPFLAGSLLRWLLCSWQRGWLVTALAAALALALQFQIHFLPAHSDEGTGILAMMALGLTLGTAVTGLICRLRRRS